MKLQLCDRKQRCSHQLHKEKYRGSSINAFVVLNKMAEASAVVPPISAGTGGAIVAGSIYGITQRAKKVECCCGLFQYGGKPEPYEQSPDEDDFESPPVQVKRQIFGRSRKSKAR
jgi:hypothetical protein